MPAGFPRAKEGKCGLPGTPNGYLIFIKKYIIIYMVEDILF